MAINKKFGVYLEVCEIPDKNELAVFNNLLQSLLNCSKFVYKDGWFYPPTSNRSEDEIHSDCDVFALTIVRAFRKVHKYIIQLITKYSDDIIDWKEEAIAQNEWNDSSNTVLENKELIKENKNAKRKLEKGKQEIKALTERIEILEKENKELKLELRKLKIKNQIN
ncbi:MAG: hypothetical protein LBB39_01085 [Mycoplasmataceae bacterium]|jgi:hypothetical protein|nr:hypothetical protein [Mycoplasmataceae bacterium]